jgi:hypothetical protein
MVHGSGWNSNTHGYWREHTEQQLLGEAIQICVVTRDLRRTMGGLVRAGIGPWSVYTFGPDTVSDLTYRGKPAQYSMRQGPWQIPVR